MATPHVTQIHANTVSGPSAKFTSIRRHKCVEFAPELVECGRVRVGRMWSSRPKCWGSRGRGSRENVKDIVCWVGGVRARSENCSVGCPPDKKGDRLWAMSRCFWFLVPGAAMSAAICGRLPPCSPPEAGLARGHPSRGVVRAMVPTCVDMAGTRPGPGSAPERSAMAKIWSQLHGKGAVSPFHQERCPAVRVSACACQLSTLLQQSLCFGPDVGCEAVLLGKVPARSGGYTNRDFQHRLRGPSRGQKTGLSESGP